jgi:hypothetical protein
MAGDLKKLKELTAGKEAARVQVEIERVPLGVMRRRGATTLGLLEIAAAIGDQPLRYLLEFARLRPTWKELEQACASGEPEWIRCVWDRMERAQQTESLAPVFTAASFHHVEVTKWLIGENPGWLAHVRRWTREARLFDVLLQLPDGAEAVIAGGALWQRHAAALERIGVPLARARLIASGPARAAGIGFPVSPQGFAGVAFSQSMCRLNPSLVIAEGDRGQVFGAFVAIQWPTVGQGADDRSMVSELFRLDDPGARTYPSVKAPTLVVRASGVSVGELSLDLVAGTYMCDGASCCTAPPQFPAISGKLRCWEIVAL